MSTKGMKEGKKPKDTAINDYTYKIFPNDLNSQGTVFGGMITSTLDRVALVIAERHSKQVCVTASIDAVHFLAPARKGDNLIIMGSINRSWRSSMEIGLRVLAENYQTGKKKHILSAYFTFVALDEDGKPTHVPPVIPESSIEIRRFEEAEHRRKIRIQAAKEREHMRQEKK